MSIDPAQDPLGAAMLAAAALFCLSVPVIVVQRVRGASGSAGGWLMGVALTGFLGAAVASAAARVLEPTPASTANGARTPPLPVPNGATDAGEPTDLPAPADAGVATTVQGPPALPPPDPALAPGVARLDAAAAGPWTGVVEVYKELKQTGKLAPEVRARWDELQAARTAAIREWMRATNRVADGKCRDPGAIRAAFEDLTNISSSEPLFKLAGVVTHKLERCRRRYAVWLEADLRARTASRRVDFARELADELAEPGYKVSASTSGAGEGKLRLSGGILTSERIAALLDGGLLPRLEAQGFNRVTFSDGQTATRHEMSPAPEVGLADAPLAQAGLAEPLKLR